MQYLIDESHRGATVKSFLYELGCSSAVITALKKDECGIILNGNRVTVRAVLVPGDRLDLAFDDGFEDENPYIEPVDLPFDILYEDGDLIAVNKPAGMPTHPSYNHRNDSLANALCYYFMSCGTPFLFRAVNRLDRGTCGAVLVSKNKFCAAKMSDLMQRGLIRKTYVALLRGDAGEGGIIEKPICRRRASMIEREVCEDNAPGAQSAVTVWRAVCRSDTATLVEAQPMTGRTHQLRVHFSYIGHPIIGDSLYGEADGRIQHQALCAHKLEFIHPVNGGAITVCAPLSDEMQKIKEDTKWRTS